MDSKALYRRAADRRAIADNYTKRGLMLAAAQSLDTARVYEQLAKEEEERERGNGS